jgi:hypothetical protein
MVWYYPYHLNMHKIMFTQFITTWLGKHFTLITVIFPYFTKKSLYPSFTKKFILHALKRNKISEHGHSTYTYIYYSRYLQQHACTSLVTYIRMIYQISLKHILCTYSVQVATTLCIFLNQNSFASHAAVSASFRRQLEASAPRGWSCFLPCAHWRVASSVIAGVIQSIDFNCRNFNRRKTTPQSICALRPPRRQPARLLYFAYKMVAKQRAQEAGNFAPTVRLPPRSVHRIHDLYWTAPPLFVVILSTSISPLKLVVGYLPHQVRSLPMTLRRHLQSKPGERREEQRCAARFLLQLTADRVCLAQTISGMR